jgi:uncharacterized protein (DUF1697 family)
MRWVGLVRNVMVGREGLDRATLLEVADAAGARSARSHLTTGNLTFSASADDVHDLARRLEAGIAAVLGRRELVAVRSLDELTELVETEPFLGYDPRTWAFEASFLARDAPALDPSRLHDPQRTVVVACRARELVAARPSQGGHRPHPNRLLEQASGLPATSRGWSTLQRIADRG